MYSRNRNGDEAGWGIHINHRDNMASQPCPQWAKGVNQLVWDSIGVIIWDRPANKVFCLSPHQALDVLDNLRESSAWKDHSFYLSWNSYSTPFSEEDRKTWRNTRNRLNSSGDGELASNSMMLSSEQTHELFLFIEKHEDDIRALGDAHVKEVKKVLGMVYAFIIDLGRKHLKTNEGKD